MDRRLAEELQADTHPAIVYTLTTAAVDAAEDGFTVAAEGTLQVAAGSQPVALTVTGQALPDGQFQLKGSVPLRMTDFGVEPPGFMGMTTGDEITVFFNVIAMPAPASAQAPDGQ
jgi:polyisoprenoid-binding protein YceI